MESAKISDGELLADLRRVGEVLGTNTPGYREYDEHGEYSSWTLSSRFNSMADAREKAGLDRGHEKIGKFEYYERKQKLLDDISEVADIVGRPPSQKEYNQHGQFSAKTVEKYFESWVSAREQAGLEGGPTKYERIPTDDLIAEIHRLADELGRIPKQKDFRNEAKYSGPTYYERFGSLTAALRKAGFEPRARGAQPGEANHYWRGGYEPYYGSNWYEQREAARERDGYECVNCGLFEAEHQDEYGRELEVHHRTPLREFDEPEAANTLDNLVTLCRSCHKAVEDGKLDLQA